MTDAPTVGLALIARDEENTLPTLLASVEGAFDRVALLDTGSKDATRRVFEEWAQAESDRTEGFTWAFDTYEWRDDFADARNHADALLNATPSPPGWKVWADADDVVTGAQNLRMLAARAPDELAAYIMGYDYAQDENGQCVCYLKRERLVRNDPANQWYGWVHEAQVPMGATAQVSPDIVEWVHRKPPSFNPSDRNLRILNKWVKVEPDNPRVLGYLGTEHAARGRHKRAIHYYRRYLKLKTGWDEERAQIHRKLSTSLMAEQRYEQARKAAHEAMDVLPAWTDSYLSLAEAAYHLGEPDKAVHWAERTLELGQPDSLLILCPLDYTAAPRLVLAASHAALGHLDDACRFADEALAIMPGHPIQGDAMRWKSARKREAIAATWAGCAETLVAHDEQIKALHLLEDALPHQVQNHPRIVALRSQIRERLAFAGDPAAYIEHYEIGGSRTEDMVPDDQITALCEYLPRAQFLKRGIQEQLDEAA